MKATPELKHFIPENFTINKSEKKLHHVFEEDDCYALWAAYSAGRPLLLRGKPGTGKSQMARAIADQLGWAFVKEVITGATEVSDLHYQFDAIARLGEAQTRNIENQSSCVTNDKETKQEEIAQSDLNQDRLDPKHYLSPGVFWWAYNWTTAKQQQEECKTHFHAYIEEPDDNNVKTDSSGVVLLLDEIDKAEPDLPNGLLETLGNYQFTVPYLEANKVQANPQKVLVIITTNEERELPSAFMRRCFVHTLEMEESTKLVPIGDTDISADDEIKNTIEERYQWLIQRGKLHFGEDIDPEAYQLAAKLLWEDRNSPQLRYPPGLAEYIDLLKAILPLDKTEQVNRLKKIAAYALNKEVKR